MRLNGELPQADAKTELLRKAVEDGGGTWRDVTALPERELAALVREDGVDVLVELTGHTAHNRLGVMALRPAPVQVPLHPVLVRFLLHPLTLWLLGGYSNAI